MEMAVKMIETGALDIDKFWSKGYDRETEWQDAFKESDYRMPGFNRGYIDWLQTQQKENKLYISLVTKQKTQWQKDLEHYLLQAQEIQKK